MEIKVTFDEALIISENLHNIFKEILPVEFSIHEIKLLFIINKFENNSLKEIKEIILKSFPSMSKKILEVKLAKTITKLIKKDIIIKFKCEYDKRQTKIQITSKGKNLLEKLLKEAKRKWKDTFNG